MAGTECLQGSLACSQGCACARGKFALCGIVFPDPVLMLLHFTRTVTYRQLTRFYLPMITGRQDRTRCASQLIQSLKHALPSQDLQEA